MLLQFKRLPCDLSTTTLISKTLAFQPNKRICSALQVEVRGNLALTRTFSQLFPLSSQGGIHRDRELLNADSQCAYGNGAQWPPTQEDRP